MWRSKREPVEGIVEEGISGEKGLWSVAEEPLSPEACSEGQGSSVLGWGAFAAALLEAEAVAVHLQDMDVMGDAIQQSAGEPFGAKISVHSSKGRLL